MPILESILSALALALALWLRPWRLMAGGRLLVPMLAVLVLLPWVWALPELWPQPLGLRWSLACLVLLMLGWPLAVPVLLAAAVLAGLLAGLGAAEILMLAFWQGLLPASFGLVVGAAVRRWMPANPFTYTLARAFAGSVISIFAAQWLWRQQVPLALPGPAIDPLGANIALWLMAWGDGILTGMLAAVFVAYRPEWLATWSDRHYLSRP